MIAGHLVAQRSKGWVRSFLALAVTCCSAPAFAQDSDLRALDIADGIVKGVAQPPATDASQQQRVFVEGSVGDVAATGQSRRADATVALDYLLRGRLDSRWHLLLSGRMDGAWVSSGDTSVDWKHTLREISAEWQPDSALILDAGRINAQFGEAIGFNPSDFFKEGALRVVTSTLPSDLRNNRQGALMARAQALWVGGSAMAIAAPRVGTDATTASLSPDFGSTNARNRWLVAVSQRIGDEVTPQLSLAGGQGRQPVASINMSMLPVPEVVAYVESSVGRRPTTLARIGLVPDDTALRGQLAIGATWSAFAGASLNLEFDLDQTGNDAAGRALLERAGPRARALYAAALVDFQTLSDRRQWFASAVFKDVWVSRFDVTALARVDPDSASRQFLLEGRYHSGPMELALRPSAIRATNGRSIPGWSTSLAVILDYYF